MTTTAEQVREVLAQVHDPEIPVLTIEDLGVLRDVSVDGDHVVVTVTPTYSGCPAMDEIRADIVTALAAAGLDDAERTRLDAEPWRHPAGHPVRPADRGGEQHLGAIGERRADDGAGQRRLGEHAGDEQPAAREQHVRPRRGRTAGRL